MNDLPNILDALRKRAESTTQTAFAKELGISASYLSDILTGRREAGPKVFAAMGLERVITYRPLPKKRR